MTEVIPAINEQSFEEIKKKIKLVEPYASWVHLDVADGTFTPNSIWHNAGDLFSLETPLFVEIHLMISDMDKRYQDWLLPNVKRIVFHEEAAEDPYFVLDKIHEGGKEAGVAIRLGGTTMRDWLHPDRTEGRYFAKRLVYQRAGEKCQRCGSIIKRIRTAGRGTFICERCQRLTDI